MPDSVKLYVDHHYTEDSLVICVPIRTGSFTMIGSSQFAMSYDADIINYKSYRNHLFPFFTVNPILRDTFRTLSIIPIGGAFISIPNDSILVEICFDVVGSIGMKSDLKIIGLPTFALEMADYRAMSIPHIVSNGSVTIGRSPIAIAAPIPSIPTLSEWSLLFLGLLLLILGIVSLSEITKNEKIY